MKSYNVYYRNIGGGNPGRLPVKAEDFQAAVDAARKALGRMVFITAVFEDKGDDQQADKA